MIDRLVRAALRLLVAALVLVVASSFVVRIISAVASALAQVVGGFLFAGLLMLFLLGCGVRLTRAWTNRNPRVAAERLQAARRVRTTARRVAEDVPLYRAAAAPHEDPDPVLSTGEHLDD